MFIYSVRASTIKFFGVICVALAGLIALIAFVPNYVSDNTVAVGTSGESKSYSYDKIKNANDVENFLSQFGWSVEKGSVECVEITIPDEFDKIFAGYNEIQRAQGLDLSKYKNKKMTRYTFKVSNYNGYDGVVFANVLVYRNKVVGGDICSGEINENSFIHGFEGPTHSAQNKSHVKE